MNYQNTLSQSKRNIKNQIVEAQKIAKDAVKADNFHCYEEAILLYDTAINEIKRILELVEYEKMNKQNESIISDTDFILLQNIYSAYYDRLSFLKANTDNNYTSNLKNIEVADSPNLNYNLRQQNIQQEFGIMNNGIDVQRLRKMQEFQANLQLFENMEYYNNMQNKQPMDDIKKTQNMNDMSENAFEDPYYGDVKPPSYTKNPSFNTQPVKNKFGLYMDDDNNNINPSHFNNHEISGPDSNIINNVSEVKNGIEPIASNNIFNQKINNNMNSLSNESSPINVNPSLSRNLNSNSSNVSVLTSPPMKTIPIAMSQASSIGDKQYNFNDNNSMVSNGTLPKKPKPLQVQIPKRTPSTKSKNNPYVVPFSSKLISQTPTTPTTGYISFATNEPSANKETNPYFQNSLQYSIEYLLMEQPHNVPKPEMLPQKLILRPFWIMRLLSRSMFEGGYLTPRVYVPKQLWYQRGAKYVAIETKYQACINLVQHLQKIRNTNVENTNEFTEVLRIFETETDAIQNMLCKKLKYIDEIVELGPIVSLDKKINMTLLWKYGTDLNLMRGIPNHDNENNTNEGIFSPNNNYHGDDRTNEFSSPGMRSNNGSNIGNDDIIKSGKSIGEMGNGRIQENILEDEILNIRGSSYSISSISINSNVTSSSKLAHSKSRLSRSMDKFTNKKGEKVGDISGYIEVLISLFNQAQIFVEWINYIETQCKNNPSESQYVFIHNQLTRISYFFGRVICTFVLKDFEMLLDRYLHKLKQNIF